MAGDMGNRENSLKRWASVLMSVVLALSALVSIETFGATIDVTKTQIKLATPEQVRDAFRRGLFIPVTEGGSTLLAAKTNAPIKGTLAVALATLGAFDKAEPLLKSAEAAKEPQARLHRILFEALIAEKAGKVDGLTNACMRAIREDFRHPVAYYLLAKSALDRKEFARAEKHANEALAFEPQMAPSMFLLGIARHGLNKREEAAQDLAKAMQMDPLDARPRLALGTLYAEAGAHAQAVGLFREVATMNPTMFIARERLGLSLLELGRTDEAVATAQEVLQSQPQSIQARYTLALAQLRAGKIEEAERELKLFTEAAPNASEGYYLTGLAKALRNRPQEAHASLAKALPLAAQRSGVLSAMATFHHLAGDLDEAAKGFQEALPGAQPGMTDRIHFQLGLLALDRKDWKKAHEWFQKSTKFVSNFRSDLLDYPSLFQAAPAKSLGSSSLGCLLLADLFLVASRDSFKKSLQSHPRDAVALLLGASASARMGDSPQALEWLAKLAALQPNYWPAHYALGDLYLNRRDWEKSEASLKRTIELDPLNEASYLRLLGIYREKKQHDQADATARQMMAKMPSNPLGFNEMAALLADRKEKLDEALTLAKKALSMEMKNGYFLDTLGWVHYQRGEFTQAETTLREAVAALPRHPEVRLHLGLVLFKNQKLEESGTHLQQVLSLAPGSSLAKEAQDLLPKTVKLGGTP